MLTQEALKQALTYNPTTGEFTKNGYSKCGTVSSKGYISIYVLGERHYAHRLAWLYMTGKWPTDEIDHKNRKRKDNRWVNLREVTRVQNNHNKSGQAWKISYIGYQHGAWCVRVQRGKYIGRFTCFGKAIRARAQAIKDLEQ